MRIGVILLVLALCLPIGEAMGSTTLSSTRVIVLESEREGRLTVMNDDALPVLVQAWIDDGRADLSPEQLDTPFELVPPLVRIEGQGSQHLRVMVARPGMLPKDKESLYWLNVVEVPRKAPATAGDAADGSAELNVVVRSRLKLIYRPAALKDSPDRAIDELRWMRSPDGQSLIVRNDSRRVISLARVRPDGSADLETGDGVVLPGSTRGFAFKAGQPAAGKVSFEWMDDAGVARTVHATIR